MASTGDTWLQTITGWFRTQRTLAAIANRECRHDGSKPMCDDCLRNWSGW